jgi:hypothetical protein
MLRWTTSLLVTVFMAGSAFAADLPASQYRSGAAIYHKAPPPPYGRPAYVEAESDVLFTPSDGAVPYIPPLITTPLLPGSMILPGYYGSTHSYDYQGPYYGGPNLSYWYRLPYACGVYGYC